MCQNPQQLQIIINCQPHEFIFVAMLTDFSPSVERKLCIKSSHCSCLESYLIGKFRKSGSCDLLCTSEHYGREI